MADALDRFGQPQPIVRSVLLYSPDSAIDGAVLEVILRKAEMIRKSTGVTVPLPEEQSAVTGALMNAVLLRKGRGRQLTLDFGLDLGPVDGDPAAAATIGSTGVRVVVLSHVRSRQVGAAVAAPQERVAPMD